ncbi:sulfotransferase ssu-1-like [Centruroides vittatus]|uniref:sulfotransferase ssu-1-like n=1 Tax=Centruroides vittatus TaxID=120091 RepID=UPI00350FE475
MAERKVPFYKEVSGMKLPGVFSEEACLSAINYKPKPNDLSIFIVTYPKCGTTWMQHIVMLILRKGKPFQNAIDFFINTPFLEMAGADVVDLMTSKGALKLHLPFHLTPFYPHAKYIYVARNPKDCCVSLYNHTKAFAMYFFQDGTFDDFFELFLRGEVEFGDYFDHLIPWYEHRNDENVYFTTYEKVKRNTKEEVLNIAKFLGEEYERDLKENPKILDDVLYYSSFEYMKKHVNDYFAEMNGYIRENPDKVSSGWKHIAEFSKSIPNMPASKAGNDKFVRKGIIGDWRNYFSKEQEERLEERIKEKTKGSDVMRLWD